MNNKAETDIHRVNVNNIFYKAREFTGVGAQRV
jgi:hypothetical protein